MFSHRLFLSGESTESSFFIVVIASVQREVHGKDPLRAEPGGARTDGAHGPRADPGVRVAVSTHDHQAALCRRTNEHRASASHQVLGYKPTLGSMPGLCSRLAGGTQSGTLVHN